MRNIALISMIKIFYLSLLLFSVIESGAKGPKMIYYDEDFYKTSVKNTAQYYMILKEVKDTSQKISYYYISGQLFWEGIKSKVNFSFLENGTKEGRCLRYHPNGNLMEDFVFLSGKKNGLCITYDENGAKTSEISYSEDMKEGPSALFYPNGKIKEKKNYADGLINGWAFYYFENGNLKEKEYYIDGTINGADTLWYETGELKGIYPYDDGKLQGLYLGWYENHKISEKYFYKNNRMYGKQFEYYATDTLKWTGDYQKGERNGYFRSYYGNGKLKREERYEDDSLITGRILDSAGKEIEYYPFEKLPEFPGGESVLMSFISKNIVYPRSAIMNELQGRVIIGFIVDKNGRISDVKVVKSVSPSLDKEAMRVVKMMPAWTPGMRDGIPVKVAYNLPVKFVLK